MIAKEWRDARWKLLLAAAGILPALLIVAAYLPPYETTGRTMGRFTEAMALQQILNVYGGGGVALALLAILLGAVTVSEEVSRSTIFLLLSKPTSRTRLLVTKYAISASVLLLAAIAGHVILILAAAARGYPPDLLNVYGVVLSTILMWIGSLSVLGLAMLFSVVLENVLVSLVITVVIMYLGIYVLPSFTEFFVPYETLERVAPIYSWTSVTLYAGEGLALLNFLASTSVAVILLFAPLWLFRRKAY